MSGMSPVPTAIRPPYQMSSKASTNFAVGLTLALIAAGSFWITIAANLGEWHISFIWGLSILPILAIIWFGIDLAIKVATKHKIGGRLIGVATVLVSIIVIGVLIGFHANSTFLWDRFGFGVVDTVIAAVSFTLIRLYGWASSKNKS
jgi:hypothetical protein